MRRILLADSARWLQVRSWAMLRDPRPRPKGKAVIDLYTRTPAGTTVVCIDELGPLVPHAYPGQPGGDQRREPVNEEVAYCREPDKTRLYAARGSATATQSLSAPSAVAAPATKTSSPNSRAAVRG